MAKVAVSKSGSVMSLGTGRSLGGYRLNLPQSHNGFGSGLQDCCSARIDRVRHKGDVCKRCAYEQNAARFHQCGHERCMLDSSDDLVWCTDCDAWWRLDDVERPEYLGKMDGLWSIMQAYR